MINIKDGAVIQELYRYGILNKTSIKHINIINFYENLRSQEPEKALKKTAEHFKCTRQNITAILKKKLE